MDLISKYLGESKTSYCLNCKRMGKKVKMHAVMLEPSKTRSGKVDPYMQCPECHDTMPRSKTVREGSKKYRERRLPKDATMIGGKHQQQAYSIDDYGNIIVWEKAKGKGWQQWWVLGKKEFEREFGVKVK